LQGNAEIHNETDRGIKEEKEGTGMGTNSAKPPAMTSFEEPIALRPADRAKGTVSPSLRPYKSARPKYRASRSIVRKAMKVRKDKRIGGK
jgi:hypothetical protein